MAGFKTYNADEVSVSIAGVPIASGYADGEFLRIEPETDAFEDVVGTDGEVTRYKTLDGRATVTVRLMQTSSGNDALSALYNLDKNSPGGAGVGAFLVRDNSGRSLYSAEKCWIRREPNVSYDRPPTEREWIVRLANLISHHGGN